MPTHRRLGRVNVRLLGVVAAGTVLAVSGIAVARHVQIRSLAERARADGLAAFARAEWSAAARSFRRYLRRTPDDAEILAKYAESNLRVRPALRSDCVAAAEALYRLFKLNPGDDATFRRLAQLHVGLRDFPELERLATRRLEAVAGDPAARIWLARAQLGRRTLDASRATLNTLAKELAQAPDASNEYGSVCVLLSATAEVADPQASLPDAQHWLDVALTASPANAEALVHRARLRINASAGSDKTARAEAVRLALEDMERYAVAPPPGADVRLMAVSLWAAIGKPERGFFELSAVDALGEEVIATAFPVTSDWLAARFRAAAAVSLQETPAPQDVAWVDAALTQLQTRSERAPILADALRVLCRAGRVETARQLLTELEQSRAILGGSDSDDELAYLRAVVARVAGDDYTAINALEPLSLRSSAPPGVWSLLAEAYSRTGQGRRAAAALTQYLRQSPDDAEAQVLLVQEYVRLRDWPRAVELARAAQAARPEDIELALMRVESTLEIAAQLEGVARAADLERIQAELQRLSAAEPKRVEIRVLQANLALLRDDLPGAEGALRRAVAECSDPLPAAIELVQVLHRLDRRDEALLAARETASSYPTRGVPQQLLAEILLAYGDGPGAITALRAACERMDAGAERRAAELKLALIELQGDARDAGIARLRALAAAESRDARPLSLLLNIPELRADPAVAQELVDAVRRIEGAAGLGRRVEQAALWLDGENWRARQQDALALLNRCIEADPAWDRPVLLLGALHEREGRDDLAEAAYRRLLTMKSGSAEIADRLLTLLDRTQRVADQQALLRSLALPKMALHGWRLAVALHARDFDEAADVLRLRISNDAGDAAARVLMARLVFKQSGNADTALAHLDEAEAISGDRLPIIVTRVAILEAAGRIDDATKMLSERVERQRDFESLWLRGAFLARIGRMQEAEADYAALPGITQDARGHEMLGAFREQQGRSDEAVATWEEGLRRFPQSADVALRLARALLTRNAAGDRARAGEIAAALAQRLPDDPDALLLHATCLLLNLSGQSADQAAPLLERAVRLNPRAVEGHLALIRLALDDEAATRARDLAIRALGAAGDDPRLFAARAQAELACGNAPLARELARTVIKIQPGNTIAIDVLEAATLATGDEALLRAAIEELRAAPQAAAPQRAIALARLLDAAQRGDEAISTLDAAARADSGPAGVVVLLALAELHARRKSYDESERCIELAATADPNSPAVFQARVMWLGAQSRHAEVAAAVRAAPSAIRDWPQVLFAAGRALSASPDAEHRRTAAELLESALARLPVRSPIRLDIAAELYGAGAIDRAEAVFREAVARQPENARALNDLAWLLAEGRGQYEEALRLADRGVQLDPDNIDLRDTRGYILMRLAVRPEDARTDLQRCADRTQPNSAARARALLKLARVSATLKDLESAARHLAHASEIDKAESAFTAEERAESERLRAILGPSVQ